MKRFIYDAMDLGYRSLCDQISKMIEFVNDCYQQHAEVKDWPKLSGVQFLLQIYLLEVMAATVVISGSGCHSR